MIVDGIIPARGLQPVTINSGGMDFVITGIVVDPVVTSNSQLVSRKVARI